MSKVSFTNKSDRPSAEAQLCLVFIEGGEEDFIEVVYKSRVKTGELSDSIKVITDSAEFEPQGK